MVEGMQPTPYVRMIKEARAVLASKYYWDVDMVNRHPDLLSQQLAKYNIACPLLSRYISSREQSVQQVMDACQVTRDEAKSLFIRLMYFGGITGWLTEYPHADGNKLPTWVEALRAEQRRSAEALLKVNPHLLAQVKEYNSKCSISLMTATQHGLTDPMASVMAMYLQTLECECVKSLVKAIQTDGAAPRVVGGIIYDGVLVEKAAKEIELPQGLMNSWEETVKKETGHTIKLVVKPWVCDPEWTEPAPATLALETTSAESWMDGVCWAMML